eukprot:365558-Chlamydomonas_euryale.AAC.5
MVIIPPCFGSRGSRTSRATAASAWCEGTAHRRMWPHIRCAGPRSAQVLSKVLRTAAPIPVPVPVTAAAAPIGGHLQPLFISCFT